MTPITRPKLPTTIGDINKFAVRIDLDDQFNREWLFGKIGYVIDRTDVGDYELGTSLRDVLLQMHWILSDARKRLTDRFVGKTKDELFDTVWNTLYGENETGVEEIANEECWAKHDITIPVDVFDRVHVFQFDEGATSRIIWRSTVGNEDIATSEIVIPVGYTEQVFAQLFDVLNQVFEWEKSMRSP
jgi:hypothetical protein